MKVLMNFYMAFCLLVMFAIASVALPEAVSSKDNFFTAIGCVLMSVIFAPLLVFGWYKINAKV